MNEAELTWNRSMRVWWLLAWRYMAGALVIAFIVGLVAGVVIGLFGIPVNSGIVGGILGFFCSLVWSAFVVRMALKKHYRDFRFVLAPNS
jgi:hypothetical protein